MPTHSLPRMLQLFLLGLVLVAAVGLVRTVGKNMRPIGGYDFHPYWVAGNYLRAGYNPYLAYRDKFMLPAPMHYVDGSTATPEEVADPQLGRNPANTAAILFVAGPLAWLPWPMAKTAWLIVNLILIGLLPWLALRLLPPSLALPPAYGWLIALAFYSMKGVRESAAGGQTSLVVFALMLAALLTYRQHAVWAGLALGVALAKYSLALPVLLFFLVDRRWRTVAVALAVQVVALLMVAAPSGWQVWPTLAVYRELAVRHSTLVGIHLGYALRSWPQLAQVAVVLVTILVIVGVFWRARYGGSDLELLATNSLLLLWALLAGYHRNYDTFVIILFLILLLVEAIRAPSASGRRVLWGFWLATVTIFALPGELVTYVAGEEGAKLFMLVLDRLLTVTLSVMLVVNLWFMVRVTRRDGAELVLATPA